MTIIDMLFDDAFGGPGPGETETGPFGGAGRVAESEPDRLSDEVNYFDLPDDTRPRARRKP